MADALYRGAQRVLQDRFATRKFADTVSDVIVHDTLSNDDKAFIGSRGFFFLLSVNDAGWPTVSYKDGAAGFVWALDAKTPAFPSYHGNGMSLSMGSCICQDLRAVHRFRKAAPHAGAGERHPE